MTKLARTLTRTVTPALFALGILTAGAGPARAAQVPAHGYVCTVTYFPEANTFVGRFGSAVVLVTASPNCQGAQTQLSMLTVGATLPAPVKFSEAGLLHSVEMLQKAALEDMRVNIVYDSASATVLWINFFAQ